MASNDSSSDPNVNRYPWQDAFKEEKRSIRQRRRIAFEIDNEPLPNEEDNIELENLTGVSLSGGGIRSALFNDGLIQSLSHRGLLRYVDYLSTVSGGGYIGGHLVSCGVAKRTVDSNEASGDDQGNDLLHDSASGDDEQLDERSTIAECKTNSFHADERFWQLGKCPETGRVAPDRLANAGGYLQKSTLFVAKYFTTQIFVFLVYFGLVGCIATLAALFWRSYDGEQFREIWKLYGLNEWGGEMSLAFYPTIWLISIWIVFSIGRAIVSFVANFKNEPRVPAALTHGYELFMKYLGLLIVTSLLIGIAALLGNGLTSSNSNGILENAIHLNGFAEIFALLAGVTQFFVFLGRDRLFKSEQSEAKSWQRLVGSLMSVGVVALLIFAMTHLMARENISHYADHRDPHLVRQDILDWQVFESLVKKSERLVDPKVGNDGSSEDQNGEKTNSLSDGEPQSNPKLTMSELYFQIRQKQGIHTLLRQEFVSKSRWERYKPGEDLSQPPRLADKDPKLLEDQKLLDRSFLGRMASFFALPIYNSGIYPPEAVKTIEISNKDIHNDQQKFLRLFNTVLESPKFTEILLGEPIEDGTNNCEKSVNSEKSVRETLKGFVSNEQTAAKFASEISTLLANHTDEKSVFAKIVTENNTFEVKPDDIKKMLQDNFPKRNLDEIADAIADAMNAKTLESGTPKNTEQETSSSSQKQTKEISPEELYYFLEAINTSNSVVSINRNLLDILHPRDIKTKGIVSTRVVHAHDQQARRGWLIVFLCLTLLGIFGTWNLNWQNSIFQFYRQSLEAKFLHGWLDQSSSENKHQLGTDPILLNECDVTDSGLPYPLMIGTWMQRHHTDGRPEYKPFVFSPKKLGITNRNKSIDQDENPEVENVKNYKLIGMNRKLQLSDAVAISGSAVTPLMANSVWLASIIDFFGVGLGQWMKKPNSKNPGKKVFPLGYLGQGFRYFFKRNNVGYVADGGYEDVLGAYELLRRRCELIIVSDACCNIGSDELGPFAKLLETANSNLGIQFFDLDHESPIDYGRLVKDEKSNLPQTHIMMRIRYPEEQGNKKERDGLLIYLQMGITDSDPIEIRQIKNKFPAFPDEPTSNQFYTQEQVAAYQKLGYYIGNKICSELVRWEPDDILRAENYRRLYTIKENVENQGKQTRLFSKSLEFSGDFYGQKSADQLVEEFKDQDQALKEADLFHAMFEKNLKTEHGEETSVNVNSLPQSPAAENDGTNFEPISPKNQPLFDVIKNRLLTGYRLACYEEDSYNKDDIFSEAVWDRNEWCFVTFKKSVEDLKPMLDRISAQHGYETKLAAVNDLCTQWLRVYQTNSDVCAVYRHLVFLDINGRMLSMESNESTSKDVLDFMMCTLGFNKATSEDQLAAVWAAHFAVIGIACQQFHRGIPRSIFQIGGKEKLTDLATSLFFVKKTREKQVRPVLPPNQDSGNASQLQHWWQWLERNCGELAELKTGVFNNACVESTVSFTQVLILHLQSHQEHESIKRFNSVHIRKRIFDAVNNFGIGDVDKIKSLEQIVHELFQIEA